MRGHKQGPLFSSLIALNIIIYTDLSLTTKDKISENICQKYSPKQFPSGLKADVPEALEVRECSLIGDPGERGGGVRGRFGLFGENLERKYLEKVLTIVLSKITISQRS